MAGRPFDLERSRSELAAARLLLDGGFFAQAVSRAYYAAFFAASQALFVVEEQRGTHRSLIAAFGLHVVREGGLDPSAGRLLSRLLERRQAADYGELDVASDQAAEAISDAEQVVSLVGAWIADRRSA